MAMMQEDSYSNQYTADWQSTYEETALKCNLTVANFNAIQSVFNVTVSVVSSNSLCVSGQTYTTKEGDTCDSIALEYSVSAATMYYINPNILNCSSVWADTTPCLPQSCASVYTVEVNDTCISIAANAGLLTSDLVPGGTYTGQALNTTSSGDEEAVSPPVGATVANGTTTDCTAWYVDDGSLTCAQICLSNEIAINLFTELNPSLNKTTCDTDLVSGDAYCVTAVSGWQYASNSTSTSNTVTPSVTAASTPGAATRTGIASNCNAYYIARANDTCAVVEAELSITSAQFLAWNPAVSSDCAIGFWAEEAYCVGVSVSSTSATTSTIAATSTPGATAVTTHTSSTSVVVPGPTQTGIPANCNEYYVAESGDDCATVATQYGVTESQFLAWNPAVSSDCETGFWADEAYCVSVSS
ncbi:hypothetical protein N7523_008630 [Penicillium sp. IBT 18751x]|nr:hypothetical protein N7523_008630 [Penicillium sp. IBT 18751x]